jgi:hypothetical protein
MALLPCRIKSIGHLEKWFDLLETLAVRVELNNGTEVDTVLHKEDLTENRTGIVNSIKEYAVYVVGGR